MAHPMFFNITKIQIVNLDLYIIHDTCYWKFDIFKLDFIFGYINPTSLLLVLI